MRSLAQTAPPAVPARPTPTARHPQPLAPLLPLNRESSRESSGNLLPIGAPPLHEPFEPFPQPDLGLEPDPPLRRLDGGQPPGHAVDRPRRAELRLEVRLHHLGERLRQLQQAGLLAP